MQGDHGALLAELKGLCKGGGLRRADLHDRMGPRLAALAVVDDVESLTVVRTRLAQCIERWSAEMAPDDRLALLAALGLHPGADHSTLSGRVAWLAGRLHTAERTARRRIEGALQSLSREAYAEAPTAGGLTDPELGWHIQELSAVLRLGPAGPELYERRKITIVRDGLDRLVGRFSLPRTSVGRSARRKLSIKAHYGVQVDKVDRPSDELFRFELSLPRPMVRGEVFEYGLTYQTPVGQPIAPHYVLTPVNHDCKLFDVRVRFDPARTPSTVWRVSNAFLRELDQRQPGAERLQPDSNCEVHARFSDMRQGLSYGIAWQFAREQTPPSPAETDVD